MSLKMLAAAVAAACLCAARALAAPLPAPLAELLQAAAEQDDPARFAAAVELISLTQTPDAIIETADTLSPEHGAAARTALGLPPAMVASADPLTAPLADRAAGWRAAPAAVIGAIANGQSDLWSGRAQLGFRQDSGNSDQLDYQIGLEVERDLAVWGFQGRLEYGYAESDGTVGRDSFLASGQVDRAIGERWSLFIGARYEQDALSGFDWTGLLNGGLGYTVLDGDVRNWRVQFGPALRFVTSPDDGTDTEAAADFTSDFNWRLSDSLLFAAETRFLASNRSRFEQRLALETELGELWALQLSYRFQYEFEPLPGFSEEDTRTDLSVIRSF